MTDFKLTCVIVDDEPAARYGLRSYINRIPNLECVAEFRDAVSFQSFLTRDNAPDIVFMDIRMPEIDGLEFISASKTDSAIIIVTAYDMYALRGYELNVTDYLLKPVSFPRFEAAVDKARLYLTRNYPDSTKDHIFIRADRILHRICITDIIYIEAMENYVRVTTVKDRITARSTMKEISQILPSSLYRVHKSFIININHILSIRQKTIIMSGDIEIPLSPTFRKGLLHAIDAKLLN